MRVYWEDTDAGGVVFYANYLKFFERARTEWLRSLGHQQESMRAESDMVFVVTDTTVRFVKPARLDDLLKVTVDVTHAGHALLRIAQQAWRLGAPGDAAELVAEGTFRIGCVDAGTFKPRRMPASMAESVAAVAST